MEQLIKLQRSQPALVQRALQRLLGEDEDLRRSVVISAYLDEEISLARAASLLELHPFELRERFIEKGVPLHLVLLCYFYGQYMVVPDRACPVVGGSLRSDLSRPARQ